MKRNEKEDVEPVESPDFEGFGFSEAVLRGIAEAGFKVASPIQAQAIPVIMEGHDLIGQAHTGTGKTAAFGLPALSKLKKTGRVEILVVTPTRELATQVSEEIYRLGKFVGVRAIPVYGGQPYGRQIESIRRGAQVVVATPGRLLDILNGGRIRDEFTPWMVVIDEADEMLDMGFIEDVQKILEFLPEDRQTLLFSATMPRPVQALAEKFMKNPKIIRTGGTESTSKEIHQQYYIIDEHEREDATMRLIDSLDPSRAMIFCRTKSEVDRLAGSLAGRGVMAQSLHGDMEQPMRERVLNGFRKGDFNILVATDVAARGIDVPDVSHVFNYHIPFDSAAYVHRIGRTGRAGRKGVAVTLVTPGEYYNLKRIQQKTGKMHQSLVPSHKELKRANENKLLEAIRMQHVEDEAENFVRTMEEEFGLAQAAHKMAALLLERDGVSGPDHIGVKGTRLQRLEDPPKRTPDRFKRFDGPGGGRGRPPFGKGPRPFAKRGDARGPKPFGKKAEGGSGPKPSFGKGGPSGTKGGFKKK